MGKKLLLLLFLLLSISINAQTPAVPPPIFACDDNNDGFAVFDLTTVIPMVLNGMNPATTAVTFHETVTGAQTGTAEISTPNAYVNTMAFGQVVFVRIQDNANTQVYFYDISLIPSPFVNAGTSGSTTICETSATPINLFNIITGEDTGGTWTSISGSGGTLNAATGLYTPAAGATSQTFMYTVQSSGCNSGSSTATVNIVPQPNAGIDGSLTVCDASTATINLFNIITGEQSGGVWTRTAGSGGSFNAAAGTYTPAAGATTSSFNYTISGTVPCTDDSSIATITINCVPCDPVVPTLVHAAEVTYTTVTIDWSQSGTNRPTTWEILVLPTGSPLPPAGNGASYRVTLTSNFTIVGLTPNTAYDVYVRSTCNDTVSDWTPPITITTQVAPPVCGGNFVDDGGVSGNYSNNSNTTTIICPASPGDAVTVTFTSFNTEPTFDALYVYNGNFADPAQLIPSSFAVGNVPGGIAGGYWGNMIPGPFISSADNGCLTFVFRSDGTNTASGWAANVSCGPNISLTCEKPTTLTASTLTETSVVLNWVQPANANGSVATAWEVLVLPQGEVPTPNTVGVYAQINTNFMVPNLTANTCYTLYIRAYCSFPGEWSEPVSFCTISCENNAECPQSLALVAFFDSNNNGIKDSGEVNFNEGTFEYQVNDSGTLLYGTGYNGPFYIFDQNPVNLYDISFECYSNAYTSSVTHNDITLAAGSGTHYLYFPVVANLQFVDAQVYVSPIGIPRPGFTYTNIISYQNNGFQAIPSGTITFTKDPSVSIASINVTGTVPTTSGFTYNFSNLAPFETRYIYVNLSVPAIPLVNLGDLITNAAAIQINGDVDPNNDNYIFSQIVVGSYDPNDKMEAHGGKIVYDNFTANDYLYYTIQCENTGTANAEFIRIEDTLDAQLDESTFEMISASHAVSTKRDGNQLTWHFYNIDLPPTSVNPTASHGYVNFRIKPKSGFAIGDVIPNTAYIYFDYNPAIVTNRFDTEFVEMLGTPSFSANAISLAPNPASRMVTITNSNNLEKIATINIYDLSGKRIYAISHNSLENISIDVSQFEKGLYLVELISDHHSKITKKLILK